MTAWPTSPAYLAILAGYAVYAVVLLTIASLRLRHWLVTLCDD